MLKKNDSMKKNGTHPILSIDHCHKAQIRLQNEVKEEEVRESNIIYPAYVKENTHKNSDTCDEMVLISLTTPVFNQISQHRQFYVNWSLDSVTISPAISHM